MNAIDTLKTECWEKRFYSFGTTKIFEKRARALNWKIRVVTFLGLLSPVIIGAFAAAFTLESETLKSVVIPIASFVSIAQAVLSLWSLISRWNENYSYAIYSTKENTKLTSDFERLGNESDSKLKKEMPHFRYEYERQERDDMSQHITDKEKRYGMRCSLFQFKQSCKTCNQVPKSMKPTKCDTCGNF